MRIGILVSSEPFAAFSDGDRIGEAVKAMGHTAHLLFERRLSFEEIDGELTVKYDGQPMAELDVIIVRPNFVEEPTLHQFVYDLLTKAGYKLVNGGAGITRTKNKILQRHDLRQANIPMPKWAVAYGVEGCLSAIDSLGYPVIIKMAFGTKGKGVFFANSQEVLIPIIDYLNVRDGNPVIIEEFIEEARRSHFRAFVVGEQIVASMEAIAPEGDVRSNAGGTYRTVDLTSDEKSIALQAAKAMGLEIAGVDLLRAKRGPLVLEVNANPGFSSLEQTTGVDVAKKIVEFAIKK